MKISGAVIQNRNIRKSTSDTFECTYKGHDIYITTDHGFGKPRYNHLKRFSIDAWHQKSGESSCSTYQDFHDIKDAIRFALIGACLITESKNKE